VQNTRSCISSPASMPSSVSGYLPVYKLATARTAKRAAPAAQNSLIFVRSGCIGPAGGRAVGKAVEGLVELVDHGQAVGFGAQVGVQHAGKPHRTQDAAGYRAVPGLGVAGDLEHIAVLHGGAAGQVGVGQHVVHSVVGVRGQHDVIGVPGQHLLVADLGPVGIGDLGRRVDAARHVYHV